MDTIEDVYDAAWYCVSARTARLTDLTGRGGGLFVPPERAALALADPLFVTLVVGTDRYGRSLLSPN